MTIGCGAIVLRPSGNLLRQAALKLVHLAPAQLTKECHQGFRSQLAFCCCSTLCYQ